MEPRWWALHNDFFSVIYSPSPANIIPKQRSRIHNTHGELVPLCVLTLIQSIKFTEDEPDVVDDDPVNNLRLERKESSNPPCPSVDDERQSGRNLASIRVRLVDEDVWRPGVHVGCMGRCGAINPVLKWAGTK